MRRSAQLGLVGASIIFATSFVLLAHQSKPLSPAPRFALDDAKGNLISSDSLQNKVVVLYFTSAQCPMSQGYMSRLVDLGWKYANDDQVKVLNIESGRASMNQIQAMVEKTGGVFPTLIDRDGKTAESFHVPITPYCIVIDREGQIRYRGAFDDNPNANLAQNNFCADAVAYVLREKSPQVSFTQAFGSPLGSPK